MKGRRKEEYSREHEEQRIYLYIESKKEAKTPRVLPV